MRRIVLWLLTTVSVLVLLFGYATSTGNSLSVSPPPSQLGGAGGASPSTDGSSGGDAAGNAPGASSTVTGDTASTEWGPVQVELTVSAGRITDVSLLQYPHDNSLDVQINGVALPILVRETKDAQSAQIDMVSGATVTSMGYLQSLQSALDQAHLSS